MNFISVLECAYLSGGVYYNQFSADALPSSLTHQGWSIPKEINLLAHFQNNFFARLYLRKTKSDETDIAVMAFRGTMPLAHLYNDVSDFEMAVLKKLPLSYEPARIFFHKARWHVREHYPRARILLTGHSLGGALAQLIAAKNEQVSVVFNSPGIGNLPDVHAGKNYHRNIHNINSRDGYINKIGKVIGTIQTVNVTEGEKELSEASQLSKDINDSLLNLSGIIVKEFLISEEKAKGFYQQHKIENMIEAIKQRGLSSPPIFY